jgi:hypothetical protein
MIAACIICDLVLLAIDRVAEAIKIPVVALAHASTKRIERSEADRLYLRSVS